MMGVNRVTLLGNVGQDPVVRAMPSGTSVANISLATGERWTDKQTGEKREATEWHRIVFFDRLAEIVSQYVKKGAPIYVEGKIRTRKYTDKSGVERYATEIVGDQLRLLGGGRGDDKPAETASPAPAAQAAPATGQADFDDDIPF